MLLHRPRGSGSVGRDELAQIVADFEGGRWIQLLDAASAFTPARPRQTTITVEEEQKRRGQAAQSRTGVDRGGIGAPKRSNFAGDEASTYLSAVLEFEPDTPLTMYGKIFPFLFTGGSFRRRTRSRWLHKRNLAHLSRRCRNALVAVARRFRTGPRAR